MNHVIFEFHCILERKIGFSVGDDLTNSSKVVQTKRTSMENRQAPGRALVVGGSIAGLSCAHALIVAGWEVKVIEKSLSPPSSSPTGAGLSLDPQAREIVSSWLSNPTILHDSSLPLDIELLQLVDDKKDRQIVARDDNFNYRCFHWTDLHSLLYKALPPDIVLWDHHFLSLTISENKASVRIRVKIPHTDEMKEFSGDLLIGADGSMSLIRRHFLPDHKLRYSGYSAWRGVYDFSEDISLDTIDSIRSAYPELGKCLYFDLVSGNHCVLFELINKRLNWIWYFDTPEPDIKGRSVTTKVNHQMIEKMHEDAKRMWSSELALLMTKTKEPFINVIYDSDPLPQLFWDNLVVLVGDAAHPTTPHCSRSTNMSVLDAEVLGLCLKKWGVRNLGMALQEYQSIRYPVISRQVLHSRHAGRLKQGLPLQDNTVFNPKEASKEEADGILHKSLPFFYEAPVSMDQ